MDLDLESDFQILALSNLITMTPGTLTLDISGNKRKIFIHAMYAGDREKIISEIKKLEKRVREVF